MWDVPEIRTDHLSHDLPCVRCGHAAHVYLPCGDTCPCVPPPVPGSVPLNAPARDVGAAA